MTPEDGFTHLPDYISKAAAGGRHMPHRRWLHLCDDAPPMGLVSRAEPRWVRRMMEGLAAAGVSLRRLSFHPFGQPPQKVRPRTGP